MYRQPALLNKAILTKQAIKYKEITFRQYRTFLKCLLGDEIDTEFVFANFDELLYSSLIDKTSFKHLNYIDYLLLALYIRCTSIGGTINLQTSNDEKTPTVTINLYKLIDTLKKINLKEFFQEKTIDDVSITLKLPSISEILNFKQDNNNIYIAFIKKINVNNIVIDYTSLSFKDKESLIQQLPVKTFVRLTHYIQDIIKQLQKTNIFESYFNQKHFNVNLPAIPNAEILAIIIRLIFNTDLNIVYNNVFGLINMGKFTGDFLDSCTPGEFFLFCKNLENLNKQKEQASSKSEIDIDSAREFDNYM